MKEKKEKIISKNQLIPPAQSSILFRTSKTNDKREEGFQTFPYDQFRLSLTVSARGSKEDQCYGLEVLIAYIVFVDANPSCLLRCLIVEDSRRRRTCGSFSSLSLFFVFSLLCSFSGCFFVSLFSFRFLFLFFFLFPSLLLFSCFFCSFLCYFSCFCFFFLRYYCFPVSFSLIFPRSFLFSCLFFA